jgi:hypothetical protein
VNEEQLTRLRLLESELLHLHRFATMVATKAYELHELSIEMLNAELARPLT